MIFAKIFIKQILAVTISPQAGQTSLLISMTQPAAKMRKCWRIGAISTVWRHRRAEGLAPKVPGVAEGCSALSRAESRRAYRFWLPLDSAWKATGMLDCSDAHSRRIVAMRPSGGPAAASRHPVGILDVWGHSLLTEEHLASSLSWASSEGSRRTSRWSTRSTPRAAWRSRGPSRPWGGCTGAGLDTYSARATAQTTTPTSPRRNWATAARMR